MESNTVVQDFVLVGEIPNQDETSLASDYVEVNQSCEACKEHCDLEDREIHAALEDYCIVSPKGQHLALLDGDVGLANHIQIPSSTGLVDHGPSSSVVSQLTLVPEIYLNGYTFELIKIEYTESEYALPYYVYLEEDEHRQTTVELQYVAAE